VAAGRTEAFFAFPADPTTQPIQVWAQDQGLVGSQQYPEVASLILRESAKAQVGDPVVVQVASGEISTRLTTYRDGQVAPGVWGVIPPAVFVVIFFFLIILQGNRMLTATLEEKENRVTEMILTTIRPTQLLWGKVVALGVIGLVQMLAIIVPSVVVTVALARSGVIDGLDLSRLVFEPVPIVLGCLMLIGSFLLFTGSLVAIGAAVPSAKDAQGMYSTVVLLVVLPIYIVMWMLTNPGSALVQVVTFFPWTAPITAMARNALGTLPWWQSVIVIVLLFGCAYAVFRVAARLFQYGSVEYSKKIDVRSALGIG
jgi:ABC-2 type transport system permease protein